LASVATLLLFAIGSTGCWRATQPTTSKDDDDLVKECVYLTEAPPRNTKLFSISGKPQPGCAEPYALCLTVDDALIVVEQLERLTRWSREAWLRCGMIPESANAPLLESSE
jgi:hypothetical protein